MESYGILWSRHAYALDSALAHHKSTASAKSSTAECLRSREGCHQLVPCRWCTGEFGLAHVAGLMPGIS